MIGSSKRERRYSKPQSTVPDTDDTLEPSGTAPVPPSPPRERHTRTTRLQRLVTSFRRHRYSVMFIAVLAWVANYLHFTQFGIYEDDWFISGFPFTVNLRSWMIDSLWDHVTNPAYSQGRPLQMLFNYSFAALGSITDSFQVNYIIAYLLFAGSAILMYVVLRGRFSQSASTFAALIFVISPLHTLRQFLNGQFSFGPAFIILFSAILLYVRNRRVWAYLLAPLTILTYESIYFLFLAAPLLRPGPILKRRTREWAIHFIYCGAIVLCYFALRKFVIGEVRVAGVNSESGVVHAILNCWVFYTITSFALYLYGIFRLHEARVEAYLYLIPFLIALIWLMCSPPNWKRGFEFRNVRTILLIFLRSMGIGLVFLALGYVVSYFFYFETRPELHLTDRDTRVSVAATFGSSIILGTLFSTLFRLSRSKLIRVVVVTCVCGFFALQFLYAFVVQNDYVREWQKQRDYASQFIALTPDVQRDSVIVTQLLVGDVRFFMNGARRPGIGTDKYFYDDVIRYIYDKGQRLPKLFLVYSDEWVNNLKQDQNGLMCWSSNRFHGRWYPAAGCYPPGRFIVLEEIQPGWLVRRSDSIVVNGAQIVQKPTREAPERSLWNTLRPTRLISKLLPDYAWKPAATNNHPPAVKVGALALARGPSEVFTFTGSDPDGYADIYRMYFLVNADPSIPKDTCHGFYDAPTNSLFLYDDAVATAMGPLTPGSTGRLQNSQCAVDGITSTPAAGSGMDLQIRLGLSLRGTYAGRSQKVYFWVKDHQGRDTGWIQTGAWTVK